mmetsp:Transcript_21919/g.58051  ORF Transcript_21919/g.58051 Transcript_21919/m.58051 type:complete len:281 (+) Transcript_21919:984-1826(+)
MWLRQHGDSAALWCDHDVRELILHDHRMDISVSPAAAPHQLGGERKCEHQRHKRQKDAGGHRPNPIRVPDREHQFPDGHVLQLILDVLRHMPKSKEDEEHEDEEEDTNNAHRQRCQHALSVQQLRCNVETAYGDDEGGDEDLDESGQFLEVTELVGGWAIRPRKTAKCCHVSRVEKDSETREEAIDEVRQCHHQRRCPQKKQFLFLSGTQATVVEEVIDFLAIRQCPRKPNAETHQAAEPESSRNSSEDEQVVVCTLFPAFWRLFSNEDEPHEDDESRVQ